MTNASQIKNGKRNAKKGRTLSSLQAHILIQNAYNGQSSNYRNHLNKSDCRGKSIADPEYKNLGVRNLKQGETHLNLKKEIQGKGQLEKMVRDIVETKQKQTFATV